MSRSKKIKMSPEHRLRLDTLIQEYGRELLVRLFKKRMSAEHSAWLEMLTQEYESGLLVREINKGGRPSDPGINKVGVYGYVHYNRSQKNAGRKLGVDGACRRLQKLFERVTVDCRPTWRRLRSMYYEAAKDARRNPTYADLLSNAVQAFGRDGAVPWQYHWTDDGGAQGPIIDRFALEDPDTLTLIGFGQPLT